MVFRLKASEATKEIGSKYKCRQVEIEARLEYFPEREPDAQYLHLRQTQSFHLGNLAPPDAATLALEFRIKGCIFRHCKYRKDCVSLQLERSPGLGCARRQEKRGSDFLKRLEAIRLKMEKEPVSYSALHSAHARVDKCAYCGKPVFNDETYVITRVRNKLVWVHRRCNEDAGQRYDLSRWMDGFSSRC